MAYSKRLIMGNMLLRFAEKHDDASCVNFLKYNLLCQSGGNQPVNTLPLKRITQVSGIDRFV